MNRLAEKFASGIARLIPSARQADDPLANVKATARWLDNLPVGDAFKCQQAIFTELKRFNENSTQFTKDRLAVFMLLDEKSRDLQDTLVRQYLRNPRMSRPIESQLWHAIYGLYWELARGYHTFVLHIGHESGASQFNRATPLLTVRAIRAFGNLLKWRAVRYLGPGEKLWLRLHNLYRIAESENFHRQPLRAYAEDPSDSDCETAYQHILMLDLANSGRLYPRQIELLDRWLCSWHRFLRLDPHVTASDHNFVTDLAADHGPRRVRKPDSSATMRYWSTSELLRELTGLQKALQNGAPPSDLGLTETARATESLELLGDLQQQWASLETREQRRAPREATKRLVDVTHGLSSILNQVKLANAPVEVSPYGTGLNYSEADDVQVYGFITDRTRERISHIQVPATLVSPDVERWVASDESECGYGAVVESHDKDWLRVGALVGIKPHDTSAWKIGVIRRLARIDSESSSVGIETLAEAPVLAMLYDTVKPDYSVVEPGNRDAPLPHASLWLRGGSASSSLILDPVHFTPGRIFKVQGEMEHKFIALGKPIENSEGWIRVYAEPVKS